MDHDARYCAEAVRRLDPHRYIAALFAAEPARTDLFALYAFNLELATVREQVSEPLIGQIRLQWWRDTFDDIYRGATRETPVVRALKTAIERHSVPRVLFDSLIDARERDVADQPADLAELIAYAEGTGGTLAVLAVEMLGTPQAADTARQAGTAWALTGLLRADRVPPPMVDPVVKETRTRLADARARRAPRAALPALVQLAVADAYLARCREPSRLVAQLRITANALRRRF
jgi:phytoene/squalene synthetase